MYVPEDWPVSDLMVMNHHPNPVPVSPSCVDVHPSHSTVHRDRSPANRGTQAYTNTPLMNDKLIISKVYLNSYRFRKKERKKNK